MHYYLVSVASNKFHGSEPLTYSSQEPLAPGSIVSVPLQRQSVLGIVIESVPKPPFATRPVLFHHKLPPLPSTTLQLLDWMRAYYPAPLGITTQLFLPKSLPSRTTKQASSSASTTSHDTKPSILTGEQQQVLEAMNPPGSYVLHGETGSGKTRVYIEQAKRTAAANKSSIILTPEISLTSQLLRSFSEAFTSSELFVLHSGLTDAQRRLIWLALLKSTRPRIVIGPRSALFSPLSNIGFIAVDESHESAYKQESMPFYYAPRVASKLASIHAAVVVFGSATPSIADYYLALQKGRPILRMKERAIERSQAHETITTIVDMRDRSKLTKNEHLSTPLLEAIDTALQQKQQVLLFINRRGTARIVLCDTCGWQALCPHCDLPLTYHHDNHSLRCHACSFSMGAPTACPECSNTDITLKSIGTKSIAASITKMFPNATVARFDTDNRKGERLNEVYERVHTGDIDILIGTQMLAKGLDLPKLAVVGVVNADTGLYLPDFTAQERTYQLLHQLIGRVGRGHQASAKVFIQTYTPDNPIIKAVASQSWHTFYETEIAERKTYQFPPFYHLLKLSVSRARLQTAIAASEKLAAQLHEQKLPILIEGPAPAFHEKSQNKFTWQLIVKSKTRDTLLQIIQQLPRDWSHDIDPINLL